MQLKQRIKRLAALLLAMSMALGAWERVGRNRYAY